MEDGCSNGRPPRLQRENLYARRAHGCAYNTRDELKISGRTNRARKRGCEACTYARPYSYTAFLVVVVVGCLLYFRFFLRPLVSTPLASHATRPNEKLVARRETALVKFRPFSSFREIVSHFSLFSLFPSFFFFLFLFFRFCVALRFSKGGFTLSLGTLSICY